ncbi:hypothetical protein JI735_33630 (plasmid) [Paenibacillus sonchi]|uniref:Uncharacterized protein n=1 Tax=Paenibacillus sonchi TaxID=373687 RepID=A0A974PIG3_9BACL|nr:hypothetical protein [Paenibacillus sonchi]QQZ64594.1 hypothetical protein JI735_33630 [Paenibacillus sonchi]
MNPDGIKKNYHSYINQLRDIFDPVIMKMRRQKGEKWLGLAWKGPLRELKGYTKHLKLLSAIKWTSLPIIGQGIIIAATWYVKVPLWSIILTSVVVLLAIYYFGYVRRYINKMATLGTPEFHIEALKAIRPSEYNLWNSLLQLDDFTFNDLYEVLNSYLVPNTDHSVTSVLQYSMGREEALEETIQEQRERIEEYERIVDGLVSDLELSETSITQLVTLITEVNTNLYRFSNGVLDFNDLRFVTPFTIYEVDGDILRKLKDVGTSGGSMNEIDMSIPQENEYAAVSAARSNRSNEAFVSNPYPGRFIVAFSMRMLNQKRWIWCFHFNDTDERALSLILSNDIIESRQVRRLIHTFCLILQKSMISSDEEEATQNAKGAN